MVLQDRYGGTYSGGAWLAISVADHLENGAYRAVRCLEAGPGGNHVEAQLFWAEPPPWIAVGDTPDKAVQALISSGRSRDEELLADVNRKIAEGLDDLAAGRVHSAEDVLAMIEARFGRAADAAE